MTTPITLPTIVPYHAETMGAPGMDHFAITPDDVINLPVVARALYIGVGGDISIVSPANNTVVYKGTFAGSILPVMAGRINATGTTASFIVGLV